MGTSYKYKCDECGFEEEYFVGGRLMTKDYCICRSQNRSCTDLKPHFNGYKTAHLPLLNRTNVYARTFRASLPVFESH